MCSMPNLEARCWQRVVEIVVNDVHSPRSFVGVLVGRVLVLRCQMHFLRCCHYLDHCSFFVRFWLYPISGTVGDMLRMRVTECRPGGIWLSGQVELYIERG